MQCSITVERDRTMGNKMKTNGYKNPYRKESNLDNIVDQLCTRLQDIKDQEKSPRVGMPTATLEHSEAVRRYYAAFPALKKGEESPLQYYLPPPAWCRPTRGADKMQHELPHRDWNANKTKKYSSGKERRNSYHGQKKSKKRCNSYSRSYDSKEGLPEWVTSEGVWDMDTQDPVKEFIRAIALDEGYGTCENTVTDDMKEISSIRMKENVVPDWDDSLDLDAEWVISEELAPRARSPLEEELYAKFEAKFDRSIEALWAKGQGTPDDDYQDLPIDLTELLSSPSDHLFADPAHDKCSLISLTESIWSNEGLPARESPCRIVDGLHDRFKPLNLADPPAPPSLPPAPPAPPLVSVTSHDVESFALYEGDEIYDTLSTVANTMRSLTAINHSRDCSGFVEVPPRTHRQHCMNFGGNIEPRPAAAAAKREAATSRSRSREDLLTAARTHFRPIRREADSAGARYADGDAFDIRGDLDPVAAVRSESGGLFVGGERYLEYRLEHTIDYTRLRLTAAQRCPDLEDPAFRLRFPLRQTDAAVQTDQDGGVWGACDECGRTAKKMRPSAMDSIWAAGGCASCAPPAPPAEAPPAPAPPAPDELSREWEELLSDISAAHAEYARADQLEEALLRADRKRRHSAALRCEPSTPPGDDTKRADCSHPHARFLHCCTLALAADRPLTR